MENTNKWCHICLAPAPVILRLFVVVCTVLNTAAPNAEAISRWRSLKYFCKEPEQNHLERIFRINKINKIRKIKIKRFPGVYLNCFIQRLFYHSYRELHKCSAEGEGWPECSINPPETIVHNPKLFIVLYPQLAFSSRLLLRLGLSGRP